MFKILISFSQNVTLSIQNLSNELQIYLGSRNIVSFYLNYKKIVQNSISIFV